MKMIRLLITSFIFLLVLCGCARISEEFARGKTENNLSQSSELTSNSSSSRTVTSNNKATTETSLENILGSTTETEEIPSNKKKVALTFDDGPDPSNTPKLLELLKKEKVPATFFLVGQNVEMYPEVVKAIAKDGQTIGSHTYDHQDLSTLDESGMTNEITKTDQSIKKLTGKKPAYFRPPYGSVNAKAAELINRPIIQWSVDSEDWKSKDAQMIIDKVTSSVYDGSIILLHDIHPETIAAVPEIIRDLKKEDYQFVSLDTLLNNPSSNETYYGENDHRPAGG